MKRLISLIIIVVISLASSISIAEPFSVRNGIRFGLSADEILSIEEKNGNKIDNPYGAFYFDTNVAGYDCRVGYDFADTKNDMNMYRFYYNYAIDVGSSDDQNSIKKQFMEKCKIFDDLDKTLSEKYTQVNELQRDGSRPFTDLFNGNKSKIAALYFLPESPFYSKAYQLIECHGYKQYITEDDENFVMIIIDCELYHNTLGYRVDCIVNYISITKEEYEESKVNMQNKEEQQHTDL